MMRRAARAAGWSAAVALLFVVATLVTGEVARRLLLRNTPPPGQLVDVGGYRLHLVCTGSGEPTVVLEAGLLDFSLVWGRVQRAVAATTRVCAYDRAGLGWSDAAPGARTSASMIGELRTLLERAGERPPFLIVGHSFGGMNARLFASEYPADVAGLVLVDAAHEDQWTRIPALGSAAKVLSGQFRTLSRLVRAGMLALRPENIPDRGLDSAGAAQYRALLAASAYFREAVRELEGLRESVDQLRAARTKPGVPVVVIRRGLAEPLPGMSGDAQMRLEDSWLSMQLDLASMTGAPAPLVATASGHDIHLRQPGLVVAAIGEMVARVRSSRGPRGD